MVDDEIRLSAPAMVGIDVMGTKNQKTYDPAMGWKDTLGSAEAGGQHAATHPHGGIS